MELYEWQCSRQMRPQQLAEVNRATHSLRTLKSSLNFLQSRRIRCTCIKLRCHYHLQLAFLSTLFFKTRLAIFSLNSPCIFIIPDIHQQMHKGVQCTCTRYTLRRSPTLQQHQNHLFFITISHIVTRLLTTT
jgi:hypothetical protein